ncbi:hypothetical protein SIN8267_02423 [Sinobacterium norvegicum]|uniref:Cytochrome c domain-containing protein n=1 Tax=Sinobacterium norvegicum TaxID=1641715 RepID=A0ABN8EM23_9GAMM|nr:cytochrome c peroxidase [Sinobacterium norvegicum]CAH0992304.1 hypothetical protein SIN8267_02423 [Sinobacterium norvegicum]
MAFFRCGVIMPLYRVAALLLLAAVSGCDDNGRDAEQDVASAQLSQLITDQGLVGDPTVGRVLPSINDAKAQLGKKLFFTKALGGDSDAACVSCHHPMLGGGDNLSLSIGVGAVDADLLGQGRLHSSTAPHFDGGPTVPRNAPTTFNIALWDAVLFLDGRVESVGKTALLNGADGLGIRTPDVAFGEIDPEAGNNLTVAQARFPVTSAEEMRGFIFEADNDNQAVRRGLSLKLQGLAGWPAEFAAVYGSDEITYARIAEAIAAYENSQVFVDTPWRAFVEGDSQALSTAAVEGALLFFQPVDEGGAGCGGCHSGDFFTDEQFHVLATPQIGRGKGDSNGVTGNDDFGRYRETGEEQDKYRFRTPTLLNVAVTGPWGHAGAYTSLAATVEHMLDPEQAVANFDFDQLDPSIPVADTLINTDFALQQLLAQRQAGVAKVQRKVAYNDEDVANLVAFLQALTDPCVNNRACMSPWIVEPGETGQDDLVLLAIDAAGEGL